MYMKNLKRMLCWILAVTMVLGLLPSTVLAIGSTGFKDVKDGDWFKEAVEYVTAEGLMVGVGGNKFGPNGQTTRAMVVTVLYRMEGEPETAGIGFSDTGKNRWYSNAVMWAKENGIVNGYGDNTFRPDKTMTREEMVAVFYRYSEFKGYDTTATKSLADYSDFKSIQTYAVDAMSWAVAVGLITGFPDGTIRPQGQSTRAQLATVLMRFAEIEVAPDDKYEVVDIYTNISDIQIFVSTEVVFYATVIGDCPEDISVVDEDGCILGILADDGIGIDDLSNDNIYTGTISLYSEMPIQVNYYIMFESGKKSDVSATIYYYKQFTTEDHAEYLSIEMGIDTLLEENSYNGTKESAEEIYNILLNYLNEAVEQGAIESFIIGKECIEIKLPSGITFIYLLSADDEIQNNNSRSSNLSDTFSLESDQVEPSSLIQNTVITLQPYANELQSTVFDNAASQIANSDYDYTFVANLDESTVDFNILCNLNQYNVIILDGHGGYSTFWQSSFVGTGVQVSAENDEDYSADLYYGRILPLSGGRYGITAHFFDRYYDTNDFENALVYFAACHTADDDTFADVLRSKGVDVFLGYRNTVYTKYNRNMTAFFFNELAKNSKTPVTVKQALDAAKKKYGDKDSTKSNWYNWIFGDYSDESSRAELRLIGDWDYTLNIDSSSSLGNLSFEKDLQLWKHQGDCRVISKLSTIAPKDGERMCLIGTGIGANNDTSSTIARSFEVTGKNKLTFNYNFVSEEPLEFVGSSFDDTVIVTLSYGDTTKEIARLTVNTACWEYLDGNVFSGGDDTTYHTGWQTFTVDLTELNSERFTIAINISDLGDSEYDSVLLIDNFIFL